MTLEEIKADIELFRMIAQAAYFHPSRDYTRGVVAGLSFALEDLEKLEPSWHEYPKEKPTKSGLYLTCCNGEFLIQRWRTYDGFEFKIDFWKELDKPCVKETDK